MFAFQFEEFRPPGIVADCDDIFKNSFTTGNPEPDSRTGEEQDSYTVSQLSLRELRVS